MTNIARRIATELSVRVEQVDAALALLDGGATVPFVARYRKEATGGLDDAQLRALDERRGYLRGLEDQRASVLAEIASQGRLDDALRARVMAADTKAALDDVYLPYRPKRRTKAQTARENGLGPLAEALLADPGVDPVEEAARYAGAGLPVETVEACLEGARAILVERFSETAELVGPLRETYWAQGVASAKVREGKERDGAKFSDYFDFSQPLSKLPAHRTLALFRAAKEDVIDLSVRPEAEEGSVGYEGRVARHFGISDQGRPGDRWLLGAARWAWRTRIESNLGVDVRSRLWEAAEVEAVRVFADNLRDLLLAAPAGARVTMGLDPGFRTGVKVAVTDATGRVVDTGVIMPHEPQRRWEESIAKLASLCRRHRVDLVAIGNGTASRETDRLVSDLQKAHPDLRLTKVVVSEAGASVYSASAYASRELPDLDVTLRGAASIARRLQDPLAELVKIDPKSIGVGQYQHDVSEHRLSRALDAVVEDCVNAVGVDVNTASAPLLARVSGLGESLAEAVVAHRDANGPFRTRADLRAVPRLGPKAFEQAAGFLRITDGDDPLDASGVHPEAYPVVRRILSEARRDLRSLMGDVAALRRIDVGRLVDERFGRPTVTDILRELEKPGRDPRPAFRAATFKEGVERIGDLRPGMILEGTVTNVAAFGAFVDVGVHQDGLVHVSAMSKTFVKDPREVARSGDVVKVKVLEVDADRKRIALTMRMDDPIPQAGSPDSRSAPQRPQPGRAMQSRPEPRQSAPPSGGALGDALVRAAQRQQQVKTPR